MAHKIYNKNRENVCREVWERTSRCTEKANKLICASELAVNGSMYAAASGTDCTAAQLRGSM